MRLRSGATLLLLALVALFAACTDEPDPAPDPTPSPSPFRSPDRGDPAAHLSCPNAPVVGSADAPGIEGDVDGDDDAEHVAVIFDEAGEQGCQGFVTVRSGNSTSVAPIEEFDPSLGLAEPQLMGLVGIDDDPGDEIVVRVAAGASTEFAGVFTMKDGELDRVEVRGAVGQRLRSTLVDRSMFAFGGSVGHVEAIDCVGDRVVVTSAVPRPGDRRLLYRVDRYFLDPKGATWTVIDHERATITLERATERLPEFAASPFASCSSS